VLGYLHGLAVYVVLLVKNGLLGLGLGLGLAANERSE
jgi:hypothetical protein